MKYIILITVTLLTSFSLYSESASSGWEDVNRLRQNYEIDIEINRLKNQHRKELNEINPVGVNNSIISFILVALLLTMTILLIIIMFMPNKSNINFSGLDSGYMAHRKNVYNHIGYNPQYDKQLINYNNKGLVRYYE